MHERALFMLSAIERLRREGSVRQTEVDEAAEDSPLLKVLQPMSMVTLT